MTTLLDLLVAMHGDAERVRRETRACRPKTLGGMRFEDGEGDAGIPEHRIAIATAGPHLAEESGTSW